MSDTVHNCPCCGAPLAKPVNLDAVPLMARLNPQEAAIFFTVAEKPGRWVSPDKVSIELWGDDPNGGPDDVRRAMKVICAKMRPKIAPFGLDIVRGYRAGMPGWFRLVLGASE